jgi:tetratricopeptide (TPR) repeat protein
MSEIVQFRFDRALFLYRQSRYELALTEVLAALGEDSSDGRTHALASMCHLHLGRMQEAENAAREAISCTPEAVIAWHALTETLLAQGRDLEALETVQVATQIDPEHADLHYQHARVLRALTERAQALVALQRALELKPEHADAQVLRAQIQEELQLDEGANESTQTVLRLDAENADAHALHGWLALRKGELASAEQSFGESLRLDPDGNHARDGLVALHKLRHPLLRWLGPSWRGPRETVVDNKTEQARSEKVLSVFFVLLLYPACAAIKVLLAHWGMASWAAWCLGCVCGLLVSVAGAAVLLGIWMLARAVLKEVPGTLAYMLHVALLEPLGDLVLALGRDGRRVLPAWRLKFAGLIWGVVAIVGATTFALAHFGWPQGARTPIAALILLPVFAPMPSSSRRWRFGLFPAALVIAFGIYVGSWSVACAGLMLGVAACFWLASMEARMSLWLAINYGLCGLACFATGISTWLTDAPGYRWSLSAGAASWLGGFVVLAVCSPRNSETARTDP